MHCIDLKAVLHRRVSHLLLDFSSRGITAHDAPDGFLFPWVSSLILNCGCAFTGLCQYKKPCYLRPRQNKWGQSDWIGSKWTCASSLHSLQSWACLSHEHLKLGSSILFCFLLGEMALAGILNQHTTCSGTFSASRSEPGEARFPQKKLGLEILYPPVEWMHEYFCFWPDFPSVPGGISTLYFSQLVEERPPCFVVSFQKFAG